MSNSTKIWKFNYKNLCAYFFLLMDNTYDRIDFRVIDFPRYVAKHSE